MSPLLPFLLSAKLQAPPMLPIDFTAVVAIVMGMLVVLIPVAGLTARFALKPITEAVARFREGQSANRQLELVERRLALLEQQMGNMETDVKRLQEGADFERQLRSGDQS